MPRFIPRPSATLIVACLALFVALAGTSVAAVSQLARNSVGTPQLKNNAVTSPKVRNGTLRTADLAPAARAALRGQAGPAGPQGPKGDKGDEGDPGSAAGAGVTEVQNVSQTSTSSSATPRQLSVPCPAGKRAIGGGAQVPLNVPGVVLVGSIPIVNVAGEFVGWRGQAVELTPTAASWAITVHAVCARLPS